MNAGLPEAFATGKIIGADGAVGGDGGEVLTLHVDPDSENEIFEGIEHC